MRVIHVAVVAARVLAVHGGGDRLEGGPLHSREIVFESAWWKWSTKIPGGGGGGENAVIPVGVEIVLGAHPGKNIG